LRNQATYQAQNQVVSLDKFDDGVNLFVLLQRLNSFAGVVAADLVDQLGAQRHVDNALELVNVKNDALNFRSSLYFALQNQVSYVNFAIDSNLPQLV
jgi:hypothetical protein